jgi:hypothetical protein
VSWKPQGNLFETRRNGEHGESQKQKTMGKNKRIYWLKTKSALAFVVVIQL